MSSDGNLAKGDYTKGTIIFSLSSHTNAIYSILCFFTNNNFQMKNCDIFLSFAQNNDCGYLLELPHEVMRLF